MEAIPNAFIRVHGYDHLPPIAAVEMSPAKVAIHTRQTTNAADLNDDATDLCIVFPDRLPSLNQGSDNSDHATHEVCTDLFVDPDRSDEHCLDTTIEIAHRLTTPPAATEPPADRPLADASPVALILSLLTRLADLETQYALDNVTTRPEYLIGRQAVTTASSHLDFTPVASTSRSRPDRCPQCDLRWDVMLDGRVGYDQVASYVWTCNRCGTIVDVPMNSNRHVARR